MKDGELRTNYDTEIWLIRNALNQNKFAPHISTNYQNSSMIQFIYFIDTGRVNILACLLLIKCKQVFCSIGKVIILLKNFIALEMTRLLSIVYNANRSFFYYEQCD